MTRRRRHALAACGVTLALAAAAVAGLTLSGTDSTTAAPREGEMPTALGAHLAQLRQAIPGNSGHAQEGPGSAEEAAFLARAYPASDIALSKIENAKSAFTKAKGRPFPSGKGKKGTWTLYGPSEALYPFTELRNATNYVPNKYVAAGRTTVLAMEPVCKPNKCRLYAAAAGGGLWRAKNATRNNPKWEFLSADFGIQAISSITFDPNNEDTIWVGTGEANASGDSAAGVGIYKSTNGGDTWIGPLGASVFNSRAVGTIAVQPGNSNIVYAGSTRAVRGISSVSGGAVSVIPGAAQWGLYKSTDGGQSWTFVHNGSADESQCNLTATDPICSQRGVRRVMIDPSSPTTVYAGSYGRGIWRSTNAGADWTQIKPSLNPAQNTTRPEFDITTLQDGKTRMYVHEGNVGAPYSRLFRSDDVATGAPVFTDLTSANPADEGYGTYNVCTGQCWYDIFVHTPKGYPDIVYVGGSYSYGETFGISNGRGVVLSTDAGVTSTDMTMDATDFVHPNGLHPDQHHLVTSPDDPFQFFEANDGGVMRSNGKFADASGFCAPRGITGVTLTRCQKLLSRVPDKLEGINDGMPTLQFMSLSVSPFNSKIVQGGTQDNGTWETNGNTNKWLNTMIGDGGQSGFDAAMPNFRFHTFFATSPEVNFDNGDTADWIWTADPIYNQATNPFYSAVITDPVVSKTMFAANGPGMWRTKTHGLGNRTLEQANAICNTWTGTFAEVCGDWVQIDSPSLVSAARGDRAGGTTIAIERTAADNSTAWAATSTGRVFVSKNVDAEPAGAVVWTRVDLPTTPGRFVSGIHVDPANGNRAWVSYSGYDASTPTTTGHVFEVVFNPAAGTAVWTNKSFDLGDLPITDVAVDSASGDIYASNDFGVLRLAQGTSTWTAAAPGMPNVEVAGLTYVAKDRILYAATHGLGAWRLNLE